MSTTLPEMFDMGMLDAAVADGYVRQQIHPGEKLAILNYSEKTAYEGMWNPVTLACRGLIYDRATSEVVARPFGKFFNYGQQGAPALDLNAAAHVTDKADGSLGILYSAADGPAIATRGSFTSEQAIHATAVCDTWLWRVAVRVPVTPPICSRSSTRPTGSCWTTATWTT